MKNISLAANLAGMNKLIFCTLIIVFYLCVYLKKIIIINIHNIYNYWGVHNEYYSNSIKSLSGIAH